MTQNMVHSAEVRWLFPGEWSDALCNWFNDTKNPEISADFESERVDSYLIFPTGNTVGVKLRGAQQPADKSKFEIKALVCAPHPFDFKYGNGRTDQWVKWSLSSEHLEPLQADLAEAGRWITVSKKRHLRKFSADSETVKEVSPTLPKEQLPENGCNVELTRLQIMEGATPQVWYSLGFEAFGEAARVSQTLEETLLVFFANSEPLPQKTLNGRDCFSFPEWLATLENVSSVMNEEQQK